MKLYTKTGDDGSTGLLGGQRVRKSDPRIECYGGVDELNASIGWAAVAARDPLLQTLRTIQNELLVIGAHLAVPDDSPAPASVPPLDEAMIARLEREIDMADSALPPLRNFILPGGCELAARLRLARTICRRVERRIVSFSFDQPLSPVMVIFLNRLSDWLFIQARLANHQANVPDIPWSPRR